MSRRRKFTDQQAIEVIKDKTLTSVKQILSKLGANANGGYNYRLIHEIAEENNLSLEHATGQGYIKGQHSPKIKSYENYLGFPSPIKRCNNYLKNKLISENIKPNHCEKCLNSTWNNLQIPLELHHINGIKEDNRLENLQVLCPNCHAQTPNYCSKNLKSKRFSIKY